MNTKISKILDSIKSHKITSKEGYELIQVLKKQKKTSDSTHNDSQIQAPLFFSNKWVERKILLNEGFGSERGLPTLLFDTNEALFEKLIQDEHFKNDSSNVILVKPGIGFEAIGDQTYQINRDHLEDYTLLFKELKKRNFSPKHILFSWQLYDQFSGDLDQPKVVGSKSFSEVEHGGRSTYHIFYLLKAILTTKTKSLSRFLYIYPDIGNPYFESISAYSNSVKLILPDLQFSCVQISDSEIKVDKVAQILVEELYKNNKFIDEVRYADDLRWVREPQPLTIIPPSVPIKKGGTYLITGGTGGLGKIFTQYLLEKYQVKLVLVGRSERQLADLDEYRQWELSGSEMMYLQADVSNLEDMTQAMHQIKMKYGALNGVIHAAGISSETLLPDKDESEFRETLKPKVQGTMILDYVTKDEPLDFFVLFSSTASLLGDMGLCDYAYANRFMDCFVNYREKKKATGLRSGDSKAINWPLWREGGMNRGGDTESLYLKSAGLFYLEKEDGMNAFEQIMSHSSPCVMVIKGEKEKINRLLSPSQFHMESKDQKVDIDTERIDIHETPALRDSEISWINRIELDIRKMAAEIIKISPEKLNMKENLGEFGFDSLSLKEFSNKLSETYKIELSPTVFFGHSTIDSLAQHLNDQFADPIHTYYSIHEEKKNHLVDRSIVEHSSHKKPDKQQEKIESIDRESVSDKNKKIIPNLQNEPIAIIGMEGIFPKIKDLNDFWSKLDHQEDLISEVPSDRWDWQQYYSHDNDEKNKTNSKWGGFIKDVDKFDPRFFNISPREAELMDPQQRLFLQTVWKAIEDAGYRASDLSGEKVGVFVGAQFNDYQQLLIESMDEAQAQIGTGIANTMLGNRISYLLNFKGPSEMIDTACSSSLIALHRAVKSIQMGESKLAIAGGVSLMLSPYTFLGAGKMGVLAPDGKCKTFSKGANGYVKGEGVGAVLLKPLSKAIEDQDHIYAVIRATVENHGGKANSLTAPNSDAQAELLVEAFMQAGIDPQTVTYIETHGTGTELGDPVEVDGLKKAFRQLSKRSNKTVQKNFCGLGSVKTNIGHLEPAAGIAGIIKVALSMKNKKLPGILHLSELNPYLQLEDSPFYIVDRTKDWEQTTDEYGNHVPRRAGISSFGFGGANAHVILEEYDHTIAHTQDILEEEELVILSAKNEERLKEYARELVVFLERNVVLENQIHLGEEELVTKLQVELVEFCAQVTLVHKNQIQLNDPMIEYGLDLFQFKKLLDRLNEKYNLNISSGIYFEHSTLNSLITELVRKYKEELSVMFPRLVRPSIATTKQQIYLKELAYTLQMGREAMEERLALVVSSIEELMTKLKYFVENKQEVEGVLFNRQKNVLHQSNFLLDGKAGQEYLRIVIEERDLLRLAQLWVTGATIDWSKIHQKHLRRVSLPTYPFAKERYWFPEKNNKKEKETITSLKLHPLIDRNISNLKEQKFSSTFSVNDKNRIKHKSSGKYVLSSSVYLEMMRAAAEFSDENKVHVIQNLQYDELLELRENPVKLHTRIYPSLNGMVSEVCGYGQDEQELVYCRADLILSESHWKEIEKVVDISEVKGRCVDTLSGSEVSIHLSHNGWQQEDSIVQVKQLHYNSREALCFIQYPRNTVKKEFELFPPVMEGAFQTALLFMRHAGQIHNETYSVLKVGKMEIFASLDQASFIYVEILDKEGQKGICNIELLDLDGHVLVQMIGVTFAPIEDKAVQKQKQAALINQENLLILKRNWKEWTDQTFGDHGKQMEGTLLILANKQTKAVAESLFQRVHGLNKIIIENGPHYSRISDHEYMASFSDPEDGRRCIQDFHERDILITGILDLSDCNAQGGHTDLGSMGRISLLQGVIQQYKGKSMPIFHITTGLQTYGMKPGEAVLAGADFAGIVKMLSAEYGRVKARTIDIDSWTDEQKVIEELIIKEWNINEPFSEICYRQGKRLIPYMEEVRGYSIEKQKPISFNKEKILIVTGGTRGLGALVAEHFTNMGAKKIVLMGQQQIPERTTWEKLLNQSELDLKIKARIQSITKLEKQGAAVEWYSGSLSDKKALQKFFTTIRSKWGQIGGVVHCAGVSINDNPAFISKQSDHIQKTFEPKIEGLLTFHELIAKDSPDFFVLFSSVSASLPLLSAGASDYAGANAFMDYFAAYQHNRGNTYYRSINWPTWDEVGMALEATPIYKKLGLINHSTHVGLSMLSEILNLDPVPAIMPCLVDPSSFDIDTLFKTRLDNHQPLLAQKPGESTRFKEQHDQKDSSDDMDLNIMQGLIDIFSEELKLEKTEFSDDITFGEYGVESIMLAELVKKIEGWVGKKLDPSILLEHPTLKKLSIYLQEEVFKDRIEDAITVVSSTDHPQERESVRDLPVQRSLEFTSNYRQHIQPFQQQFSRAVLQDQRISAPKRREIAIIGMGCQFPDAEGKEAFWNNLAQGKDSIREVPKSRWDSDKIYSPHYEKGKSISKWGGFLEGIEYFDPGYFNIQEEDAYLYDPLIRKFLEVSVQTFNDAGYDKKDLWNRKVGVFVGARAGGFASREMTDLTKNSVTGIGQNFIAAHISHLFNFKGPNLVVDSACSSSLVSIHLACQSLLLEESELALAGGVDIIFDEKPYLLMSEGRALSPDGKCHTFDEKANGFVPGEGCGAVLLKPLEKAIADGDQIYAVIEATAVNNDGHTMGITTPNPEAQFEVISEALSRGEIDPNTISYIETHGTGTMIGDPIELKALTRIFRQTTQERQFCSVGSVKTNIGHLLSAAGIASFIKVVLSIVNKQIPPTLHCENPNPRFQFENSPFYPNTELNYWEPRADNRRAGISSFGFGGTNAHVIVSECSPALLQGYKQTRFSLPPVSYNKKRFWIEKSDTDPKNNENHHATLLELEIDSKDKVLWFTTEGE